MSALDVSDAGLSPELDRPHPAAQDPLGGDALSDPLDDAVQLHELSPVVTHSDVGAAMAYQAETLHPDTHFESKPDRSGDAHEAAHALQNRSGGGVPAEQHSSGGGVPAENYSSRGGAAEPTSRSSHGVER